MNNDQSIFRISQQLEIVPHQKNKVYPIGVEDWDYIKKKIGEIKIRINNFHAIGFLLLGTSISCFITIIVTEFKSEPSKYLVWSIFGVALISGLLSVYFASDKHKQENAKPDEIISQMELIESKFENKNQP